MEYGYIYKTTNLLNGMIYIGQKSGTMKSYYLGSGKYILRAIKKYGKENFRLEVLAFATTQAMLDGLEQKYIYEYRQIFGNEFLYNIVNGGSDGQFKKGIKPWCTGTHLSEEIRKKISLKRMGQRSGKGNHFYGKKHTPESRRLMSESRKGMTPWNKGLKVK